jgi:hypothetical protein
MQYVVSGAFSRLSRGLGSRPVAGMYCRRIVACSNAAEDALLPMDVGFETLCRLVLIAKSREKEGQVNDGRRNSKSLEIYFW